MMYRWWCEGGGDRAWWIIKSVLLRSADKGFWACLGDLPPNMPRRPEKVKKLESADNKIKDADETDATAVPKEEVVRHIPIADHGLAI